MLSRGTFIGEIIDMLGDIANQVSNRGKLHLFDLHKIIEDTFKEILNKALNYNLKNLNKERSNEPGIDLGDISHKIAFQITSRKDKTKIEETLKKITANQKKDYRQFIVLIVGLKQSRYSLDNKISLIKDGTFDKDQHIWDITDLSKQIVPLNISDLHEIYKYLKQEFLKVKIELEIPDESGNFETNISHFIEPIVEPKTTECLYLWRYLEDNGITGNYEIAYFRELIIELGRKLSNLPRLTRELLSVMLDRCDKERKEVPIIYYEKLTKICHKYSFDSDLALLVNENMISVEEQLDDQCLTPIEINLGNYEYAMSILSFLDSKGISYSKVFTQIDFSDL